MDAKSISSYIVTILLVFACKPIGEESSIIENRSIDDAKKVILKIDGEEQFFYWELVDEAYLWEHNAGEVGELDLYKDTLRIKLGSRFEEVLEKVSTQELGIEVLDTVKNGDRINALLVNTDSVGVIRKMNHLESQILNYQMSRFPMFSKPTEFHAFIAKNELEGLIRVYFASSNTEWPPKPRIIVSDLKEEVLKGWKVMGHLHNHFCKEDSDYLGILAPSLSDAQYYKGQKERFNLEKALITNGFHTVEIDQKDFEVFESY